VTKDQKLLRIAVMREELKEYVDRKVGLVWTGEDTEYVQRVFREMQDWTKVQW
jgi:hypothetical protein